MRRGRRWRCAAAAARQASRSATAAHADSGFTDAKDPNRVAGPARHLRRPAGDHARQPRASASTPGTAPTGWRRSSTPARSRSSPPAAGGWTRSSGPFATARPARSATPSTASRRATRSTTTAPAQPAIEVTKDGPYRVTGGIALVDADGGDRAPRRRARRASTTRCAAAGSRRTSRSAAACTGTSSSTTRSPARHEPTIFEWAGGLPALTRMTRLFYEKYVPQDPLLAPLFANMSADHPSGSRSGWARCSAGPTHYSEQLRRLHPDDLPARRQGPDRGEAGAVGGAAAAARAARPACPTIPSSAPRSAPTSSGARGWRWRTPSPAPSRREHMPMPHWDWTTAAGPPGSRISGAQPAPAGRAVPVVLPHAGEPVGFEQHIQVDVPRSAIASR